MLISSHLFVFRVNGIDFEEIEVKLANREQHSPEFKGKTFWSGLLMIIHLTSLVVSNINLNSDTDQDHDYLLNILMG